MAVSTFFEQRDKYRDQTKNQRDIQTQIVISAVLGLLALLAFCLLRPRWKTLYAARRRQKNAASILPELPDTFFGWIPTLYRISEHEVLASAGLDAYVFLSFFHMAAKFTVVTFFFQLVIMLPIHHIDTGNWGLPTGAFSGSNSTTNATRIYSRHYSGSDAPVHDFAKKKHPKPKEVSPSDRMLWLYVLFVYLFSALAIYLVLTYTKRIIKIRQTYLGSQSSLTDRTIRLSGIPEELRSEEGVKKTVEDLKIGKVESVLLCRDWSELDALMSKRLTILKKLEEAWTVYLSAPSARGKRFFVQQSRPSEAAEDDGETARLLDVNGSQPKHPSRPRPTTRMWYGFMGLQSRKIDAIDYFEEQLRRVDDNIKTARRKIFKPMPLAFVTLDSTATAQMSVQALVDPQPMQLVAHLAPAPSDVIWENTYLSRSNRMLRAWTITFVIAILSVFWIFLLLPLARLLSMESIGKISPQLRDALNSHQVSRALVQTSLPTLLFSLLAVLVPYLYYWLSTYQGMNSQGEIEMSLISKNFFFSFFNLFVIFTVFGTVSTATDYFDQINKTLKDTTTLAYVLARSLTSLVLFYMNLIILQGLGLFPFRLVQFGSMCMYAIYRIGAKTPRDYAELVEAPVFSYAFYLPQTILIFVICIVYSTLPGSWFVLFFGTLYFLLGSFIHKYQLLYSMDHRQHTTGRAWPMICNRVVFGLVVFQLAMAGILGLNLAFNRAALIVPLLVFTIWFIIFYNATYKPLMTFIAIRSLKYDDEGDNSAKYTDNPNGENGSGTFGGVRLAESRNERDTSNGRAVDDSEENGVRYINPNLVMPLEEAWLARDAGPAASEEGGEDPTGDENGHESV